jgi:hypothetical protein
MNVSFIFPRFKYKSGDPPLGIAYLASYLKIYLHVDVEILESVGFLLGRNSGSPSFGWWSHFFYGNGAGGAYFDATLAT